MSDSRMIYDEMCRVLTDYEGNGSEAAPVAEDLYDVIVKIQNHWEYIAMPSMGSRGVLADWLAGTGPYMHKVKGSQFTLMRVRKNEKFDYLYIHRNSTGIERGNKFEYAGVYCRRNGLVYDCSYTARDLFDDANAQDARSTDSLFKYLKSAVRSAVELAIGNDRDNLYITELSSERMLEDLARFQGNSAISDARKIYLGSNAGGASGDYAFIFQCNYRPEQWTEDSLLAYILDPDEYVRTEAKKYTDSHQEVMLLDFLKGDMVAAAYEGFIENPLNPIHNVKRIMQAVSASPAKTITVTIRKGGVESTFKTEANEFRSDCTSTYSNWRIMAADRHEFKRLFGNKDYGPEDILRIEYARSVLYENEAAGREVEAHG